MMRLRLAFLFIFIFVGIVHAQDMRTELMATSQKAFEDGFYDVTIKYLGQLLNAEGLSPKEELNARMLLGQSYFLKNDFERALQVFDQARNVVVDSDVAVYWMAETLLKLERLDQAASIYRKFISNFPNSVYIPQAYYGLGWMAYKAKDYQGALNYFDLLIQKYPGHPIIEDTFLRRGECLLDKGDFDNAQQAFKQFLEKYPGSGKTTTALLSLADAQFYLEDYSGAIASYSRVIATSALPEEQVEASVGKAWCFLRLNDLTQAQQQVVVAKQMAKEKSIESENLSLVAGEICYAQNSWEAAAKAFSETIEHFPKAMSLPQAYLGKANSMFMLNEWEKSLDDYKSAFQEAQVQLNGDVAEKALSGQAWCLMKLKRMEEAKPLFDRLYEKATDPAAKANALIQYADGLAENGEASQAQDIYTRVLKEFPTNSMVRYVRFKQAVQLLNIMKYQEAATILSSLNVPASESDLSQAKEAWKDDLNYYLGVAFFKIGNWAKAAFAMDAFLKNLSVPSDFTPQANYILALSYLNLHNTEEALKIFQKILRLYPNEPDVSPNADLGIAKCLWEQEQSKESIKRFKMIVFKYPGTETQFEGLLWLAQYYLKNADFESAIGYYEQIIKIFSQNVLIDQVYYELGQAYEQQNQYEKARNIYDQVGKKDAEFYAKAHLAAAGIYAKERQMSEAIKAYEEIVRSYPLYARDALVRMAQLYRLNQNYDKELEMYDKAFNVNQGNSTVTNAELHFNAADAYENLGLWEDAVNRYLAIPSQYPKETAWIVKAYLRIAKIYENRRDWEAARVTYRKIIQLNSEEAKFAQERLECISANTSSKR